MTAGYDNATRIGVPRQATITSVGGAFSPSVALHAVALMLALQRGVPQMALAKGRRHWDKALAGKLTMALGKTCTVLGYGSIGHEITRMVAPLGMTVIGLNRTGAQHPLAAEVHRIDALHAILPRTDVLIVAAPHNPATDKIIGARELALMKPTALLVNISRGKLVDTPALDAALRAGTIAGAALDVTEPEPLPEDHPLWDAPNLIVSPHVAGAAGSFGAERQLEFVGANLRRYLAGEPVHHVVRP
jgi:phosphoglycerate dehydrogenase-like enzyme